MKKKTIANLIMVVLILAIAVAGILGVGYIQGWFDADDGTNATLQDMRGVIHLMREGVSYPVSDRTVLRTGDRIETQNGASVVIRIGDDQIILGEKAAVTIKGPAVGSFVAEIHSGEVFAHCDAGATLCFAEQQITIRGATALLSVRSGAQSVSVLRGAVDEAVAGQLLQFVSGEKTVGKLTLASLNDFTIAQIRKVNDASLYFTSEDLDRLAADRQQALQDLINGQTKPTDPPTEPTEPTETTQPPQTETTVPPTTTPPETTTPPTTTTPPETTTPPATTTPPETTTTPVTTTPPETIAPPQTLPPETTAPPVAGSCILAIYCDTILNNMGSLAPGKAEFVPSDGMILVPVTVNFFEGETVFDVLKRVCDRTGIQLEYSWTPLYDSYYVEGINHLYEFDCGFTSGWMYKVNGWFPNYGCSDYTLKDGDVIVWCYTCEGLGTDVGAPEME